MLANLADDAGLYRDTPTGDPVDESAQPRLEVKCPKCGHKFVPNSTPELMP
jgi:hypothetical protein